MILKKPSMGFTALLLIDQVCKNVGDDGNRPVNFNMRTFLLCVERRPRRSAEFAVTLVVASCRGAHCASVDSPPQCWIYPRHTGLIFAGDRDGRPYMTIIDATSNSRNAEGGVPYKLRKLNIFYFNKIQEDLS